MQKFNLRIFIIFFLINFGFLFVFNVFASNFKNKVLSWPFEGMFGYVDTAAAKRGFQVYKDVCASCHSLTRISYVDLLDIGFSEEDLKNLTSQYQIFDEINDNGNQVARNASLIDKIVSPYKNEKMARSINNGFYPPDLSLITKARFDGPNYIYSLLTGYYEKPKNFILEENLYFNLYFPHYKIGMPPPLLDNLIEYQDGTISSVEQMAHDVVIFLQWCAEPEMRARKILGLKVLIFLSIFTILSYFLKKKVWRQIKQ